MPWVCVRGRLESALEGCGRNGAWEDVAGRVSILRRILLYVLKDLEDLEVDDAWFLRSLTPLGCLDG